MRVLMVAACPFPSAQGTQVYVRGLSRALARRGHDVTVACYAHGDGPIDPELRYARTPRIPGYARLRSGPDPVKPLLDLALAARLHGAAPDVVVAHGHEALLAARLARIPARLVYVAHTRFREELPTYFDRGRPLWGALGAALDRSPALADTTVALSARTAATFVVPPGVDPEDFAGVRPRRAGPGRQVVYAGNPDRYQDLEVLYAAVARVPEARLRIVTAARWPSVPPGATVVRTSRWSEAREHIAGADVAAVPRSVCAGFPMKLLNALALGLPTVIAAGGSQGIPGEIVVANRDPAAFADGIRRAFAADGSVGRAHVLAHCTWAARAAAFEAILARPPHDRHAPAQVRL